MGGGSSRQTIQCDANEWTRIMRGGGLIARTYRVKFSTEGDVEWRRRSGGPPFYLSGTWRVRDHDTHSQCSLPTNTHYVHSSFGSFGHVVARFLSKLIGRK